MDIMARVARALLSFALAGMFATAAAADSDVLRIGTQKYGTLIALQAHGSLEQRLAPLGVTVQWTEFPSGPVLLEALAAGSIDIGLVGEAPPVFAQAAGTDFVYVAADPPAPAGEGFLVPKDSPLKSVADLKGKRVALNKGSNVHYLLVAALKAAGLQLSDIEAVYLAPADARAAFERGSVDAWVIWDPYYAAGQAATEARVLADATGIANNYEFYVASRRFAERHPDYVRQFIEELDGVEAWAATRPHEVAEILAPRTGLAIDVLEVALKRISYGAKPLGPEVVANQQAIADAFLQLGLIPKALTVRDAVWQPPS